MLREEGKQYSFHSMLYNKIPEDHLLKVIDRAVDFSFINEMVAGSYCREFGRPAKEPELMAKLLFLEHIYDLSDEKVIKRGNFDLSFLWFLGLNPEEELPDPSLLAKFRTQRLQEATLDDILTEIIRQCVENGIIKGKSLSVDTTHILANTTKKVPERVMKHLAKKIFKGLKDDIGFVPEEIPVDLPDYKEIEDHQESKETMKTALETVMEAAEPYAGEKTEAAIAEAKEILSDEKFLLQKGVRSLSDKDARVGSKSKTDQFFGYKAEFTMTTDERLITAIDVHSGEYVDGKEFSSLLERTQESGVQVEELMGDKAYFRKDILEELDAKKIKGYIPVSASVYKIDEELFAYNKDSDQWFCFMGNHTVGCKKNKQGNGRGDTYEIITYLFKKEQCKDCPHRDKCIGSKGGKKNAGVSGEEQEARRAGVEERRNETLPRNEPCPRLGQAERELPGKVYRDCRQPETNRRVVARHGAGGRKSRGKTKKFSTSGAAGRMPRVYCAHLPEKQGEYHPFCADILPVFCPFRLKLGLFQWF